MKTKNDKIEKTGKADINLLVSAVADRRDGAFEMLKREYAPLIAKETKLAALRLSEELNAPESELYGDLEQEAMLALYKAAMSYDPEGGGRHVTFGLFAKICIHNAMVSELRRECGKKRRAARQVSDKNEHAEMSHASDASAGALSVIKLEQLIGESGKCMSKYEKQVFDYYIQGKSVREISHLTDRSYRSVNNALYRLRVKLKGLSKL